MTIKAVVIYAINKGRKVQRYEKRFLDYALVDLLFGR